MMYKPDTAPTDPVTEHLPPCQKKKKKSKNVGKEEDRQRGKREK